MKRVRKSGDLWPYIGALVGGLAVLGIISAVSVARRETQPPANTDWGSYISVGSPSRDARPVVSSDGSALYPEFIRRRISPLLIDPGSAQFTKVLAKREGQILAFCGLVNSRNRMGGYAGPQAFVISDAGTFLGAGATSNRVFTACQGATVQVPDF